MASAEIYNKALDLLSRREHSRKELYLKLISRFESKEYINLIIKNLYETGFFENINVKIQNKTLVVEVKEYKIINEIVITGEKTKKYKKNQRRPD